MKKLFKVFLVMGIVMSELCFAAAMDVRPSITGKGGPDGPLMEGTTAYFYVHVSPIRGTSGLWFRNGKPMPLSDNVWSTVDTKGTFTLTMTELYLTDAGDISFRATNNYGTADVMFKLEVYAKEQ